MKNLTIFLLIFVVVSVILSDCDARKNKPKNLKSDVKKTSQPNNSISESSIKRPGEKSITPSLEATGQTKKKRTKQSKRNKTIKVPTSRQFSRKPADPIKNQEFRASQTSVIGPPCCLGCPERAVQILREVFNLISRYDYASMTQLDKIYIQPIDPNQPTVAFTGPPRDCSRMLMVKQKFYQADVYLYGCTDQVQACAEACKHRAKWSTYRYPGKNQDNCSLCRFRKLIKDTDCFLCNHYAPPIRPIRSLRSSERRFYKKKKRSLARRSTTATNRTTKSPIEKRSVGKWSGEPGVAFYGFRSDESQIDPLSGSLAVKSVPHAHPWLVHLTFSEGRRCAGVLLPWTTNLTRNFSDYVLTAAHCFRYENENYEGIQVSLGVVDFDHQSKGQVQRTVSEISIHPNYMRDNHKVEYDAALIKLDKSVRFSRTIAPIALPLSSAQSPNRYSCVVAGWQMTRKKGHSTSSTSVQHVQMYIESDRKCREKWADKFDATNMICSNTMTKSEASCYGDSGGPLTCRDGSKWTLVGVVSMGEDMVECINSTKFLISSRVESIIPWIRQIQREQESPLLRHRAPY